MRSRGRSGVTFVELVTVLAMLGVILAIAAPRIRTAPRQADVAAVQLTLAFEEAQRVALSKQLPVLVVLDSAGARVRLVEDRDADGAITAGERARWLPLDEGARFAAAPSRVGGEAAAGAIVGAGFDTVGTLPAITFRRDGSASVTAEVYLELAGRTVERRAVLLPRATARAEWYRYTGSGWMRGTP